MSKQGVTLLLILCIIFILGFSYYIGKMLLEVEKAAIGTMETYCGPETAKRFKEREIRDGLILECW